VYLRRHKEQLEAMIGEVKAVVDLELSNRHVFADAVVSIPAQAATTIGTN
jgi:hypothetical protein